VEVVDDYTVRITTLAPDPILLERLAFQHPIYPADYAHADGLDRIGAQPVGTGPYKFRSWTRGHELVFEAKEDYWGPVPEIKTLTFRIIPEDATVLAEFLSGG